MRCRTCARVFQFVSILLTSWRIVRSLCVTYWLVHTHTHIYRYIYWFLFWNKIFYKIKWTSVLSFTICFFLLYHSCLIVRPDRTVYIGLLLLSYFMILVIFMSTVYTIKTRLCLTFWDTKLWLYLTWYDRIQKVETDINFQIFPAEKHIVIFGLLLYS